MPLPIKTSSLMMSEFAWTVFEHYDTMHMQANSDEGEVLLVMDRHRRDDKTFTLTYWSSVDSVRATIRELDFATALRYAEQLLNGEMEYRMVPKEDA